MCKDTDRVFMIDSGDGLVSMYSAETEDNVVRLRFHKNDTTWTEHVRDQVAIEGTVGDEAVAFKTKNGRKFKLDYSEIEEMIMLLEYLNEDSQLSQFVARHKKFIEV